MYDICIIVMSKEEIENKGAKVNFEKVMVLSVLSLECKDLGSFHPK